MIKAVIFDLGAVLIDWKPEYLYQKIYPDESEMREFLRSICTSEWNEEQDAGRSLKEGTDLLLARYPEKKTAIRAFYDRWEEMLGGPIPGTVKILEELKASGKFRLYALTNWSAETFPVAERTYDFLGWFDGIVVSGVEKMRKPAPEFYRLLLDRFSLEAGDVLFIDDNARNTHAAEQLGIRSIHFTDARLLRSELEEMKIL
ncbi:HAD family hydrolase [Hufsiella ginkgonis]|uniref:HAD-IA family hydrolase n=1 Tax=Hufsiella ginkgonis TaxID=2695274 RepID=A0A7K1XYY3_9SPHI|nr:HAD family phosphatase [Hufsiella ginkgonis]MXV16163.1 HAD-IA family hydrolase [Hufsiella ginkgonis]